MTCFEKATPKTQVESAFVCETCCKTFQTQHYLKRHVRRNHTGIKYQCYYCDFDTKFKECLVRHVPLHLEKKEIFRAQGAFVKCPLCEFGCVVRETMLKHYVDEHDVNMQEQHFEFPNTEEFLNWKYQIEQTDVCQFTSRSKKNRGAVQIRYYRCFRDGIFHKRGRGIRNLKLKGSLKINGICPAGFKAEEDIATGAVKVTFIRSHVGHSHELGLMNLSKHERADIARKLSMGMTFDEIIGSIHGSMDTGIRRLHLTTFKDVWNVQCSFGLRTPKKDREKNRKTSKTRKKGDVTSPPCSVPPEFILRSDPPTGRSAPEISNRKMCSPPKTDHMPVHNENNAEGVKTNVWDLPCQTEAQETGTFYDAQNVPERANTEISGLDSSRNLPSIPHVEPCESSCDNNDHYFEMIPTDTFADDRLMPLENLLIEKKSKIRSKLEELLDSITTEEHSDMLFNALVRFQNTIEASSSAQQFQMQS